MALNEYDFAVMAYADSRSESSEAVYARLDKMDPIGYRDQKTVAQLLAKLNALKERETTTYKLPYGIEVKVNGKMGSITSTLKASWEFDPGVDELGFNWAVDVIESLVLAHACAGVDIGSDQYVEGLTTALDAIIDRCS